MFRISQKDTSEYDNAESDENRLDDDVDKIETKKFELEEKRIADEVERQVSLLFFN